MYSYLDKTQVGAFGRRPEKRGADRPSPGTELAGNDLDSLHVGDVHTTHELLSQRIEEEISRGRHPAADDDPLHAQEHDHVAGPYPEVPAGVAETQLGAGISRAGRGHRLLDIGPAASICDGVGAGKRFEAATVAAVAHRAIGVDGLVAELARGAAVAEVQP